MEVSSTWPNFSYPSIYEHFSYCEISYLKAKTSFFFCFIISQNLQKILYCIYRKMLLKVLKYSKLRKFWKDVFYSIKFLNMTMQPFWLEIVIFCQEKFYPMRSMEYQISEAFKIQKILRHTNIGITLKIGPASNIFFRQIAILNENLGSTLIWANSKNYTDLKWILVQFCYLVRSSFPFI